MKKVTILLIIAFATAFIGSCSKEEQPGVTPTPKTKFELLTEYNWVLTEFFLDGEDKFKDIPACEKDNIDKYLPNGDFIYDVGQAKCGTERQVRSIAQWEFTKNETVINRSDGVAVTIIELTNSTLITEEKRLNGVIARYQYTAKPSFNKMIVNASKPWRLTGLTNNGIDAYGKLIECEKDNKFFFFASGKYTLDEGATTCAPNAPQVMESEWLFANNETQIKIDKTLYTVKEITSNTLVLEFESNPFITVYTYTAQ